MTISLCVIAFIYIAFLHPPPQIRPRHRHLNVFSIEFTVPNMKKTIDFLVVQQSPIYK